MKIAVYGLGSFGTIMGAYLSKTYVKYQVDLVDINQQHVNDLNEKGAHVVGSVEFVGTLLNYV